MNFVSNFSDDITKKKIIEWYLILHKILGI